MLATLAGMFDALSNKAVKRRAAKIARQSDRNLELLNASGDVIMRCGLDAHKIAQYVSPSSFEVLGYLPEEMVGRGPVGFVHPDDVHLLAAQDSRLKSREVREVSLINRMIRKDGTVIWVESRVRTIEDPGNGRPESVVLVLRDITLQKNLQDQLQSLAFTDSLTGLSNRRGFDETLAREWARTLREATQMSLLLIDVDHFKQFNDQYGHQVGDDCIRAVAAAITQVLRRAGDVGARYGGDELAIILAATDAAGAVALAEQVIERVQALRLPHAGNPEGGGFVSVSIGAATALCRVGGSMEMPQSLLAAADNALYKSKLNGRNRVTTSLLLTIGETAN